MGKRRMKQNGEERDKVNVSLDDDNKGIKLSKTISTSYFAISNADSTNMKKTKSNKQMRKDEELDNVPVDNENDKSNEDTSKKTKTKKHNVQEQETINIKSQEKSIEDNKKNKKKRKQIIVQDVSVAEESSSQESQPKQVKIGKDAKKKQKIDIGHTNGNEGSQQTKSINVNKKENKQIISNKEDKKTSIQKEVVQNEEINNEHEIKKPKKKNKRKIVEEEPINDEDIDKYCDELDPSYHKQYEDWVKLIEASLSSNTKVKK